jgi:signal transduction histidine kinase
MSHELRTPLNAILGYQDLLEAEVAGPVTAEQRRYFDRIRRSTGELLELIDQILSLSRIDGDHVEPGEDAVDVATIVEEIGVLFGPAASRKGLDLRIRKPPQPILVHADPKGVREILRDLVSNAVKFTDAGHVAVEARTNRAGYLIVEVSDTGPGIPEQDLTRIFEPFVQGDGSPTRRHGGAGLGLPVSRKLARAFGGDLTAASRVGVGSVFTLDLPSGPGTRPAPSAG